MCVDLNGSVCECMSVGVWEVWVPVCECGSACGYVCVHECMVGELTCGMCEGACLGVGRVHLRGVCVSA